MDNFSVIYVQVTASGYVVRIYQLQPHLPKLIDKASIFSLPFFNMDTSYWWKTGILNTG